MKNSPTIDNDYNDSNEICNLRVSFDDQHVVNQQKTQRNKQVLSKSYSTANHHKSKSTGYYQSLFKGSGSSRKQEKPTDNELIYASINQSQAQVKPPQVNTENSSPLRIGSRQLSKAESRYLNQPSPSFASNASQNQSVLESNRNLTNRSALNPSKYTSKNLNDMTNMTGGSAFKNAGFIFQKIESTTQKVTSEILENQKHFKDLTNQRKDLQQMIESLKIQVQKAEKDNIRIKDKLPKYSDVTAELSSRLVHKRGKSMESIKDITLTKQSIKQLEDEKEDFLVRKQQLKQSLKIEDIRYQNLHKQVAEIKVLLVQSQKEKEKLVTEINKQQKIIKNFETRKKTLNEYNMRYFDNFQHTTSKMLMQDNKGLTSRSKILN